MTRKRKTAGELADQAGNLANMAGELFAALKAEQKRPDRFTTACLALAQRAAQAGEHSYNETNGSWTVALVEALKWDLLYQDAPRAATTYPVAATVRARDEANRLIVWARENPDELDTGYDPSFIVWDV